LSNPLAAQQFHLGPIHAVYTQSSITKFRGGCSAFLAADLPTGRRRNPSALRLYQRFNLWVDTANLAPGVNLVRAKTQAIMRQGGFKSKSLAQDQVTSAKGFQDDCEREQIT
jgi:hypothetical protein